MGSLPPEIHVAVHEELRRAEEAHDALLIAIEQDPRPEVLRHWLLEASTYYERAAQRIPEGRTA